MRRHTQQSLLLYNLQLPVGLECMRVCISFPWLVVGTSPVLHWAQQKGGDRKYEKREANRDEEDSCFGVSLLPCLGSVCLIKDLSAWPEPSCNLSVVLNTYVHHSKFLLWWDKNPGREINWPDKRYTLWVSVVQLREEGQGNLWHKW